MPISAYPANIAAASLIKLSHDWHLANLSLSYLVNNWLSSAVIWALSLYFWSNLSTTSVSFWRLGRAIIFMGVGDASMGIVLRGSTIGLWRRLRRFSYRACIVRFVRCSIWFIVRIFRVWGLTLFLYSCALVNIIIKISVKKMHKRRLYKFDY